MERFHKIWTPVLLSVLAGIGLGIILILADPPVVWKAAYAVAYLAMLVVAFIFQVIAHEGGHLIGGMLSGYELASFRVFNIMIVKRDGKYLRKKFHIVGTGGQCLMAPPQPFHPDYPYRLYNLAGGLTNFILAGICIALCIPVISGGPETAWVLLILNPLIVAGIYCGITNLFPMIIGGVSNDGYNLTHLGNDPEARRILWLLLDVMAIVNRGGQFRDMPEEWFSLEKKPTDTSTKNPDFGNTFQSALGVYRFNYLEDTGRLEEAEALAAEILRSKAGTIQLDRNELLCESIFLELIGKGRLDRVERMYTPELQRYIKATASYPHRQRLHYAMALLYHRDEAMATKSLELFAKACKSYPNEGEISSEWEMIGLVDCKLAEVNALAQQAEEEADAAAQMQLENLPERSDSN